MRPVHCRLCHADLSEKSAGIAFYIRCVCSRYFWCQSCDHCIRSRNGYGDSSDAVVINHPYTVTLCAFLCSMAAVLLIMALSRLRGFSSESIVLAGTALSSLFAAGTTLIQYFGMMSRFRRPCSGPLEIWDVSHGKRLGFCR